MRRCDRSLHYRAAVSAARLLSFCRGERWDDVPACLGRLAFILDMMARGCGEVRMQRKQVREGRRCIFLFGELRVYVKVMSSLTSVHSEMGKMMSDSLTAFYPSSGILGTVCFKADLRRWLEQKKALRHLKP